MACYGRHLSRRQFVQGSLALGGLGLLAGCGVAPRFGQRPAKVPVIGFLSTGSREARAPLVAAFLEGLQELGYVEGRTIAIEYRFAESDVLPDLAAELVGLEVDLILASGTPASTAAKQATTTVPVVMAGSGDPVTTGLVASLARPGGNVTGTSLLVTEVSGKPLELLTESIPGLARVAVISNETNPVHVAQDEAIEAAARALGIRANLLSVRGVDDLGGAFQTAKNAGAEAMYSAADPLVTNARTQIAELALRYRLPTTFVFRENVDAGGLLAYGPVLADVYRRTATYVDKILKGEQPGNLPIEQPTNYELFINAKTARFLGLTIPPSVLQQATEIIQ